LSSQTQFAGALREQRKPMHSFWFKRLGIVSNFWTLALVLLLVCVTIVPIVFIFLGSFKPLGLLIGNEWTLKHYRQVWSDPFTYILVRNTVIFAAGSTLIGIVIALLLSWLIERTDLPGRGVFRAATILPMVTPPLLLAIGWVLLMSPAVGFIPTFLASVLGTRLDWLNLYSLGGMMFVMGLAYVPTGVLMFSPIMRNMDPAYEEASRLSGASAVETVWRVSLPFLMPSILSTATLLFIVGMLAFDIPAIIGNAGQVFVMSTEVYRLLHGELELPNYGAAAAFNSILFVVLMLFLVLYSRLVKNARRFVTVSGRAYRPTRYRLGKWRTASFLFVVGYFLLGVALPFIALIWVSLTPYLTGFNLDLLTTLSMGAYGEVLADNRFWTATGHATVVGLFAAIGAIALALAVSRVSLNPRGLIGRLVAPLSMLPLGIPHLMMGIALVFMMLNLRFLSLHNTLWIIAIGHIIAYLPIASRMMQLGMIQLSGELEEAAMTSGANTWQRLRGIVIPLMMPTFIAIFIWMFVHSIREFSIAVILQGGGNEVLSTLLFDFWSNSFPGKAAAMSTMITLALLLLAIGSMWLTGRRREK